jgi:hypothetical protein
MIAYTDNEKLVSLNISFPEYPILRPSYTQLQGVMVIFHN